MKTRSSFPGEVSFHTIPRHQLEWISRWQYLRVVAQTLRHSIKVVSVHLSDTYELSSTLPGEMGREIQNNKSLSRN